MSDENGEMMLSSSKFMEIKNMNEELILSCAPEDRFPYIARCNVSYSDGEITFLGCVLHGAVNA